MTDEASRSRLERAFEVVPTLVGTGLGWIRRLVVVGVVLAFVDAGLVLLPRRNEGAFVVGALFVLVVALLPALALHRLGKRFAAFRDGVVTIRQRLPELTDLPRSVYDGFNDLAPELEKNEGKRLPGRLIATARSLVQISKLVRSIVDRHKELLSASTTVIQYGPRDALLAVYGVLGLVGLACAMPVVALWALLA